MRLTDFEIQARLNALESLLRVDLPEGMQLFWTTGFGYVESPLTVSIIKRDDAGEFEQYQATVCICKGPLCLELLGGRLDAAIAWLLDQATDDEIIFTVSCKGTVTPTKHEKKAPGPPPGGFGHN